MAAISPQLLGISQAASNVALLAIFAFGIVLVVLVPYTLDIVNAHKSWREIVTTHPEALKDLPDPSGIRGLARATMALALIVVIAFGLGYVLVEHPFPNSNTIVSNILVALTTALASITAFYFGSRAATEAQAGSSASGSNGGSPAANGNGAAAPAGAPAAGENDAAPAAPAAAEPAAPAAPAALTVTITSPNDGATFTVGQVVNASYGATPSEGAEILA